LHPNTAQFRHRRRTGFTLMEILLVLALLVAIAAISLPALNGPMENHRLRMAGDMVRVEWSHARNKAMESGRTYVFKYQPELGNFKIEPWYLDDDYLESSNVLQAGGANGGVAGVNAALASARNGNSADPLSSAGATPTSTTATSTVEIGELPEKVQFVGSETEMDERSAYLAVTSTPQGDEVLWSDPIFFYPDGTSSTVRLLIRNSRARYLIVSIRGLTGVVQVSDLLNVEEIQ